MPANYTMSWEPRARRWWKQHEGRRYVVSCRQLTKWSGERVPETKEGSYQIANAWWKAKLAELGIVATFHPHDTEIRNARLRRDWHLERGEREEAEAYETIAKALERNPDGPKIGEAARGLRRMATDDPRVRRVVRAAEDLTADDATWGQRLSGRDEPAADRSVEATSREWLALKATKVRAGELSPRELDGYEDRAQHFRDWFGTAKLIDQIDARTVERFYIFLSDEITKGRWSKGLGKKIFSAFRQYVEWAASRGTITLPANLWSRDWRFTESAKAVPVMTPQEVHRLIEAATGQLKLHLLLMCNCGMTQGDVSDLRHDEVDWEAGRIRRKRSKTRDEANVPVVDYPLWEPTSELLREYRSDDPEVALVTKSGSRWVYNEWRDGKLRSSDSVATNYQRLQAKLREADKDYVKKPLRQIRATSASLLGGHDFFGRYAQHFLGHSPRGVTDKHYVRPSVEQFDRAIAWLGEQYGLVS